MDEITGQLIVCFQVGGGNLEFFCNADQNIAFFDFVCGGGCRAWVRMGVGRFRVKHWDVVNGQPPIPVFVRLHAPLPLDRAFQSRFNAGSSGGLRDKGVAGNREKNHHRQRTGVHMGKRLH